ncbi:hypothetical protein DIPPA_16952 [Diplonema papillatum]|nr:hypothetical protein DIPPA_16952 [Diplonema papillatum]
MCLGSITPEHRIFDCVLPEEEKVESYAQRAPREEELVGEVCVDGVRRFKNRRVLCRGAEVLVDGWLAEVVDLDMDAETVVVCYSTTSSTATVALQDVRSVLTNPINRDLQLGLTLAMSSVSELLIGFRKSMCPLLVY